MAYLVSLAPRAERDLTAIFEAIHASESDAALHWYLGLRRAILSLEKLPRRCSVTPENKRFGHLFYGRKPHVYRVIFRLVEEAKRVDVLHIRYGARDRFSRLRDR
jgi:plasmid stabilization system protein ParE